MVSKYVALEYRIEFAEPRTIRGKSTPEIVFTTHAVWDQGTLMELMQRASSDNVTSYTLTPADSVRCRVLQILDNELPEPEKQPAPSAIELSQQIAALQERHQIVSHEIEVRDSNREAVDTLLDELHGLTKAILRLSGRLATGA